MAPMFLAVAFLMLAPALAAHFRASKSHDVAPVCQDNTRLIFHPKNLYYSNLKGYGPHSAMPQGMLISDVFGVPSGRFEDLLIRTVEAYYPFNVSANTIDGDVVSISMDAASTVELQLTFLDRATRQPTAPGRHAFTFMNFERLSVKGCKGYDLSDNTLVVPTSTGKQHFEFTSSAGKVNPTRAFSLTADEMAGAVMLQCNESSITVEATMRQGQVGDNLYITGASSVSCPRRTTCEGYNCQSFFVPYLHPDDLYCAEDVATMDDLRTCCYEEVPTLCQNKHTIMFGPKSLLYSNLGGNGPDIDKPEGVRYTNVLPKAEETIDMVFNVVGDYVSVSTKEHREDVTQCDMNHNGLHGKYGRLTVSAGRKLTMEVSFRSRRTDELVAISTGFFFTVYDFDQQANNQGQETLRITGYDIYMVSPNSTVSVVATTGGKLHRGVFRSSVPGTEEDNPKHPSKLSDEELAKSVTFGYPANTTNFSLELEVSEGFAARNFEFTGFSVLPCPAQAQCSSLDCPVGYRLRPEPDTLLCEDVICSYKHDRLTCCVQEDMVRATCASMLCPLGYGLREQAASVVCTSELCGEIDETICCKQTQSFSPMCTNAHMLVLSDIEKTWAHDGNLTAKYINVFPYLNRTINMKAVFSITPASPTVSANADAITPTITASLCRVPLPDESNVLLDFRFVDPDGEDVLDMPDFYFTLFGGSIGVATTRRTVTLTKGRLVPWTLSEDTAVVAHDNHSFVLGSLGTAAATRLETSNPFALDDQARRSGISWLMNASGFKLRIESEASTLPAVDAGAEAADGALFFGGASCLTCNPRASCAKYECPSGFTLRENPYSLVCFGEACTADDSTTCCDCDPTTAFLLDAAQLQQATLGDQDSDRQVIVISNVFPESGEVIHLRVKALTDYFTGNASLNTLNGGFLNLNLRTSSETTFRFGFVGRDGEPTRVPFPFIFSAFDLDQQDDGGAQEQLKVINAEWFVTSDNTKVHQDLENGTPAFHSTSAGRGWDNPTNPLDLYDHHIDNSVSFLMKEGISSVDVTFKVRDGFGARNMLFAGQSNLLCSTREVCEHFTCPDGKALVSHASIKSCHAEVCTARDEEQCCRDGDVPDEPPVATQPDLPGPLDIPIEETLQ